MGGPQDRSGRVRERENLYLTGVWTQDPSALASRHSCITLHSTSYFRDEWPSCYKHKAYYTAATQQYFSEMAILPLSLQGIHISKAMNEGLPREVDTRRNSPPLAFSLNQCPFPHPPTCVCLPGGFWGHWNSVSISQLLYACYLHVRHITPPLNQSCSFCVLRKKIEVHRSPVTPFSKHPQSIWHLLMPSVYSNGMRDRQIEH
jgi:hypothetical protein